MIKFVTRLLKQVILYLALSLGYGPALALSAADVSKIADSSIGRVITENGTGSGFVISRVSDSKDLYFVTNSHVVEKSETVLVVFGLKGRVQVFEGQVVVRSDGHDLAVVRLMIDQKTKHIPPLLPLVTREIEKGEPVYAIGFPGISDHQAIDPLSPDGMETTLSDGLISRVTNAPWEPNGPSLELIQHTAAINSGNSGGPLLDSCARVLGVNTAIYLETNDVYLASSSNSLSDFLRDASIPFEGLSTSCSDNTPVHRSVPVQTETNDVSQYDNPDKWAPTWLIVLMALLGVSVGTGLVALFVTSRDKPSAKRHNRRPASTYDAHSVVLRLMADLPNSSDQWHKLTNETLRRGVVLGRRGGADFPIDAPKISRRHAKIYQENRKLLLVDLGSTNGTKVDGNALTAYTPVQINSKSVLNLGGIRIRLSR